jgi:hypothetical protein
MSIRGTGGRLGGKLAMVTARRVIEVYLKIGFNRIPSQR